MTIRSRLRTLLTAVLLSTSLSTYAIDTPLNTVTIITSAASLNCLEYRVVGICYWLHCSIGGCKVRTSVKVRHYIPEAVVSSYQNTGQNPWIEMALLSPANTTAKEGGDGTNNDYHENNLAKFKNADVIGHPATIVFSGFASSMGYSCAGAATPFFPYFLSTLDTLAWRYAVPEMAYPEALIPGMRDIGSTLSLNQWGAVYPRGGFLHQSDDYKAAAVIAQRAGDIVTRTLQSHVYMPLLTDPKPGYWPAGALIEGKAESGKWQELTPKLSMSCATFPHSNTLTQDEQGAYAFALWRPYACCKRRGQVFLGSVEF